MKGSEDSARVAVGQIVGAFGLRGELKLAASDPADLHAGLAVEAALPDGSAQRLTLRAVRPHKNRLVVRFTEVLDVNQADALRGAQLYALASDLPPLPPNTFRVADLVGMQVVDARLGVLGTVRRVEHYPYADMLVVGEREHLVPMLAAYGVAVDEASATISTALPEGFEEL